MTTSPPDGPLFPPVPGASPEPPPSSSRRGWIIALAALLVVAIGVIVFLLAQDDGSEAPTASPSEATSSTAPEPEPTTTTEPESPPAAAGCAANGIAAPTGANVVTVVDVDGDGKPDKAWISPGAGRQFGITTASGATFSIPIESASPQPASAVVNLVQKDKLPIALVSTGRRRSSTRSRSAR